jgi:hypothetical protein
MRSIFLTPFKIPEYNNGSLITRGDYYFYIGKTAWLVTNNFCQFQCMESHQVIYRANLFLKIGGESGNETTSLNPMATAPLTIQEVVSRKSGNDIKINVAINKSIEGSDAPYTALINILRTKVI